MRAPVLVVGHSGEEGARALVATWPEGGARLLTPASFAGSKLSWRVDAEGCAISAIGARPAALAGVVTLMGAVFPSDLPQVAPADRDYVAGEMTAFLSVWLHSLPCRKLNAPTLASLSGERDFLAWRAVALARGLSVRAVDACAPPDEGRAKTVSVAIVGERTMGSPDREVVALTRAFAERAGLSMLSLELEQTAQGYGFVRARAVPDPTDPEIAEAIFAFFDGVER